jgi:hypothetical protein
MINTTKIYLITNCYNDINKVYIGKTKNSREADHKRIYGSQIVYTYIDEVNSLDYKDWEPLETYWIEQFRQWGFIVLNENKGGGGPVTHSEIVKDKMKGPKPYLHKSVIQYSLKGDFIREWSSITEAALFLNKKLGASIVENCSKKRKSAYGFIWRYKEDLLEENFIYQKDRYTKPINQYDLQMNFIKEWPSLTEAKKYIKGDIQACCSGKQKTAGNYIWRFKISYE